MAHLASLIDVDTLAEQLGDESLRILDATVELVRPAGGGAYTVLSGRSAFDAAHIPGAGFADLITDLADPDVLYPFAVPSPERFAAAAGQLGIGPGTHVVVYAQAAPMWATRLWWLLRYFGFDDVSVLDGGLPAWVAAGHPVSDAPDTVPPATFTARPRPELLARRADVEAIVGGDAPACLVNALDPATFRGEGPPAYRRPGRIPGSVNAPWAGLVDPATNRFRPPADLAEALDAVGAREAGDVVVYCGGGISATIDVFALALLGRDDVRMYDGSLTEWTADPGPPARDGLSA